MIGYFPETGACFTCLWHAVLSEGCALKGNTKLASTEYGACTDVACVFWWYILILTYSHSFFCFVWTNTAWFIKSLLPSFTTALMLCCISLCSRLPALLKIGYLVC